MKPINIRRLKVGDKVQHTVYCTVAGEVVGTGVKEGWLGAPKELTVDVYVAGEHHTYHEYSERFWRKINADS